MEAIPSVVGQSKRIFANWLGRVILGGAKSRFCSGGALRVEISIKRVDGGVQNQVTIGASFQVALDLILY
jgi:hypothetical protein